MYFALTQAVLAGFWLIVLDERPVAAENVFITTYDLYFKVSFYVHMYGKRYNIIWAINITDNVMNIINHKLQNKCLSVC